MQKSMLKLAEHLEQNGCDFCFPHEGDFSLKKELTSLGLKLLEPIFAECTLENFKEMSQFDLLGA